MTGALRDSCEEKEKNMRAVVEPTRKKADFTAGKMETLSLCHYENDTNEISSNILTKI